MPVKILLADKSITIQKVVEMLFSGKDYEVQCVSDGETALNEAERAAPDVILADIDLPRLDGYGFAARIKQMPALAKTPVILMMSRDDVFDANKANQSSIVDHIAKPFESQDLIGKVKKAISGAAPPAPTPVRPTAAAPAVPAAAPPKPKQAPPADIFDIIQEAPSQKELRRPAAPPAEEESVYEVEPVVEVEEPLSREMDRVLPTGKKAVEEMRAGLGLGERSRKAEPDIVSFESLDMATSAAEEYRPKKTEPQREPAPPAREMYEPREYVPPPDPDNLDEPQPIAVSEERLRSMVEETVSRLTQEYFKKMPAGRQPQRAGSELRGSVEESASEVVRELAREVIEKVAWEVIPALAEALIKAEIERMKTET
jgi:CheY-like chemotaxis protein